MEPWEARQVGGDRRVADVDVLFPLRRAASADKQSTKAAKWSNRSRERDDRRRCGSARKRQTERRGKAERAKQLEK